MRDARKKENTKKPLKNLVTTGIFFTLFPLAARIRQRGTQRHTNVHRVFPVFQHLRHHEGVDISPVLSVLIVLQRFT